MDEHNAKSVSAREWKQEMNLTEREREYLVRIAGQLDRLRRLLNERSLPAQPELVEEWFAYLSAVKGILGNANNDVSFVATLQAKAYLMQKLRLRPFDAATKAQGAPGLDIDERTLAGERVIGEIKTTVPYGVTDLGAQQRMMFQKDFAKLRGTEAAHKFFFVTAERTFRLMQEKYARQVPGVRVVLLGDDLEWVSPE